MLLKKDRFEDLKSEVTKEGEEYKNLKLPDDSEKNCISFCEFYKETIEVSSVEELCNIQRYGKKVIDMFTSITNKDVSIY